MELTATAWAALVSALLLGLSAGVFFTFSNSVMPGLRVTDDRTYVAAFNAMNVSIQNPLFFLVFVGALVAPGVTAIVAFVAGDALAGWLAVAATAVYLVGVIGVTGAVNVPLNNALARTGDRRAFEARWVRFNHVRTVASTLAFVLAILATLQA